PEAGGRSGEGRTVSSATPSWPPLAATIRTLPGSFAVTDAVDPLPVTLARVGSSEVQVIGRSARALPRWSKTRASTLTDFPAARRPEAGVITTRATTTAGRP